MKKLKQWSKSAGNCLYWILNISIKLTGTSETLRDGITTTFAYITRINKDSIIRNTKGTENIKNISIHSPKHLKPANEHELGHYLAGLIDGDGHFSSAQQLVIVFNYLDIQLAYYIRERIGHGNVRKVKDKNAVLMIISSKKGIERVIKLINNKFRTTSKLDQINKNILTNSNYLEFNKTNSINLNSSNDLENHWIAGFSDADASFQIKIINHNKKTASASGLVPSFPNGSLIKEEVRLNYQIFQKKDYLLILIKKFFGGNIGYIKSQDTYYYGSTSFGSAKMVINYFDRYHLLSNKNINYLKWRKAYVIIQNKDHLIEKGLTQIKKLKSTMNNLII